MAGTIDFEAKHTAYKVLYVTFIIAILAANIALLIKFLRKGRILLSQRKFLVMTLAGGDIFMALFPLVVAARTVFEEYFSFSCSTLFTAAVYWKYYLPFVYGLGLVFLCAELRFRRHLRSMITSPYVASILIAAVLWIFGLILILPLAMAGFDTLRCSFDSSMTIERLRALILFGMILPPVSAVIFAIAINCKKIKAVPEYYDVPSAQGTVISTAALPESQGTLQQQHYFGQFQSQYNQGLAPSSQPSSHSVQPITNVSGQLQSVAYPAYPPNSQKSFPPSQAVMPASTGSPESASDEEYSEKAVRQEQRALLAVSILNVILTLPLAIFTIPAASFALGYQGAKIPDGLDALSAEVLGELFLWMLYLRSILTPLVWMWGDPKVA
ncbi:uncharacterized protein LOC101860663 [Aplysia californica]|uniref:Uncharacterized protein LOC101860663 n=1 Tax=Aplysia californica TaxID=6500 RepID=A0ABM0JTR7_APLCA|nr:uncharacterized protein LOC101860663 [Aplysia californica]